ncbi:glutathione synthetase-like [Glandiceps talaboti]
MASYITLPIPTNQLDEVVSQSKDYCNVHGVVMRKRDTPTSSEEVCFTPHTLIPSPVPLQCFQHAIQVQDDFNRLIHGVSLDYHFLKSALQSTIKLDEFNRRLFDIYEEVYIKGTAVQPIMLGMLRCDYMFDCSRDDGSHGDGSHGDEIQLKQIEINTMASGLAGLGSQATYLHRFNLENLGLPDITSKLPDSLAVDRMAEGFVEAWNLYGNPKAAILFLIEEVSWNITDQRWLEYKIRNINKEIPIIRRQFIDVMERAKLDNDRLVIDNYEIAIVYYRYGYAPSHYRTEKEWETRLMLEKSLAIKCPSIVYHLAGTKKVQQELSQPGAVERFQDYFPDPVTSVQRIRDTFAGLYTLDMGSEGDKNVQKALSNPDKYVLKPQREGGGNNVFGEDIVPVLKEISHDERRAGYILMSKIEPLVVKNYPIISKTDFDLTNMVSELGIFGAVIRKTVMYSNTCGHILRTKLISANEGSFANGSAVVDSPCLIHINNIKF